MSLRKRDRFQVEAERGKFSKPYWVGTKRGIHAIVCCDCGLVHDETLAVFLAVRRQGKIIGYRKLRANQIKIARKVRRNERATAGIRRAKRHKGVRAALKRKPK